MAKRVLDVGQCGPDHATVQSFFARHFDCEFVQAHGAADALEQLRGGRIDLVLVNRKLDQDYSDGIEIIRLVKAEPAIADVPMMLITNYPEHQAAAVAAGAVPGFGKLEFDQPETSCAAPRPRSMNAASVWPRSAARIKAVSPLSFTASIPAPAISRAFRGPVFPFIAASIKAVSPK